MELGIGDLQFKVILVSSLTWRVLIFNVHSNVSGHCNKKSSVAVLSTHL